MTKFKTISEYFRGQGKDEAIEKLLAAQARDGYQLVAFTAEQTPFAYRFIFAKTETEKKSKD